MSLLFEQSSSLDGCNNKENNRNAIYTPWTREAEMA